MAYLEWYQELDKKYPTEVWQRAYELAWFLCPRRELVEERILPGAVDIVLKSIRKYGKRRKRLALTDLQLLQIGILQAAGEEEHRIPLTRVRGWMRYIRHLTWCTLPQDSFPVLVGFGSLLSNGPAKETVELYNYLDPPVNGRKAGGQRIDLDWKRAMAALQQQIYARYQHIFETCGHKLGLDPMPKSTKDELYNILERMILWETPHLPATFADYCQKHEQRGSGARRLELEQTRAHIGIDQEHCLKRVKSWHARFGVTFDIWRLPRLRSNLSNTPNTHSSQDNPPPDDNPWRSPEMSHWDEIETRIKKEILWKEHEEKEKQKSAKTNRGQEAIFEVVVDGTVNTLLNWSARSSGTISLPSDARYVEIRERASRATVANCHLMNAHDLPQTGWKSAVKLFSGEQVQFVFFPPPPGGSDEGAGISMRVKLKASPWQSLVEGAERLRERGPLAELLRIPAVRFVTVLLALVLVGAGWSITTLRSQFDDLARQLHFDEPFAVRFSAVGQRSLQLDLRLHTDVVREIFVDWGDPSQPDPVGGTRIYPNEGIEVEQGKLLLSPITHEYGPVAREGFRTSVRVRIVPTALPKVRPESLSEANLTPARRVWILPYGIVLDPPEARLNLVAPKQGEVVSPSTEVQIRAGALTADIHLLALDPAQPTVYRYLGKMPPPAPGQELNLTRVLETSPLGMAGPFRLVVVSSNQLVPAADQTVAWHDIPPTVPRDEVEVRHAGRILFPLPGAVVSSVGMVRTQIFLPHTYAAVVIRPAQEGSCWIQNDGRSVTPFVELPLQVSYGGRDSYQVYVGVTEDPDLFKAGDKLPHCPLRDRAGKSVYWIGPVEVTHE